MPWQKTVRCLLGIWDGVDETTHFQRIEPGGTGQVANHVDVDLGPKGWTDEAHVACVSRCIHHLLVWTGRITVDSRRLQDSRCKMQGVVDCRLQALEEGTTLAPSR